MRAYGYRNYGALSQSSLSVDFYKSRFLVFAHAILLSIMGAYLSMIKKTMKAQEQGFKSFSDAVVTGTGFTGNLTTLCRSPYSFDLANKKFKFYYEFLFYTFVASAVYNLLYIAFEPKLPQSKTTLFMAYAPLAIMGIVGIGFSVDGFVKIRSLTKEPVECQRMFDNYKAFFIVAMTASVVQTFVCLWILSSFVRLA